MVTQNSDINKMISDRKLTRILQENAEEELFQTIVDLAGQGYSHKDIAKECEGYLENMDIWRISRDRINDTLKAHSAGYTYDTLSKYRADNRNNVQLPQTDFRVVDGYKTEGLVSDIGEGYQFEVAHSPAEVLSMQDARKVLESYVNRLPLQQKDVIFRRFYGGQTLEQVADAYFCSSEEIVSKIRLPGRDSRVPGSSRRKFPWASE